jgi:spermidine/putrescine transport system substrate-binding protein
MLAMGKDTATATIDDYMAAIDKIDQENKKGQIRRFTGNDYTTDLTKGNVWVSVAYSGDVIALQADNPDLKFVIPDEGGLLWTDNMMIPQKPPHPYAAEVMMNYVYEPAVAAKLVVAIGYVSPVVGAQEELAKTDPKLAHNPLAFPTDASRKKLHPYPFLPAAEEQKVVAKMQQVTGA